MVSMSKEPNKWANRTAPRPVVSLRLERGDLERVNKAAAERGVTRTEFMRAAILAEVERTEGNGR